MIQAQQEQFPYGYTAITELDGKHRDILLDFGILRLREGERWENSDEKERAFLLISGFPEMKFQLSRILALGYRRLSREDRTVDSVFIQC